MWQCKRASRESEALSSAPAQPGRQIDEELHDAYWLIETLKHGPDFASTH